MINNLGGEGFLDVLDHKIHDFCLVSVSSDIVNVMCCRGAWEQYSSSILVVWTSTSLRIGLAMTRQFYRDFWLFTNFWIFLERLASQWWSAQSSLDRTLRISLWGFEHLQDILVLPGWLHPRYESTRRIWIRNCASRNQTTTKRLQGFNTAIQFRTHGYGTITICPYQNTNTSILLISHNNSRRRIIPQQSQASYHRLSFNIIKKTLPILLPFFRFSDYANIPHSIFDVSLATKPTFFSDLDPGGKDSLYFHTTTRLFFFGQFSFFSKFIPIHVMTQHSVEKVEWRVLEEKRRWRERTRYIQPYFQFRFLPF